MFYMNGGRRDPVHFPSFLRGVHSGAEGQEKQRCILSLDLSFIPRFWLCFGEVIVLCATACTVSLGDDRLQLNLWTGVRRNYAKLSQQHL